MKTSTSKFAEESWWLKLSFYVLMISSALLIYGYTFPTANNIIEVPPVIALLNPELFKNDYYVQDTLQFTPRYYYQYLVFLIAKLGLGIAGTYFFFYVLSFSSFVVGLYTLGKRFGRSNLSAAALVFLGLFTVNGTVGYVSIFRSEPIAAVLAMGLSIWGIYFCFCKRWNLGYLFLGIACIVQFLIGLLPGLLMAPILLLDCQKKHQLRKAISPLLILITFAAFIYLPMVLSGGTGSSKISDQEFVFLYGYIRQPHHYLPSAFPIQNWVSFLSLIMSGILFIINSNDLRKEDKVNFIIIIATSLISLFLGYIFVEIYPSAFIAKLQFARTTPFAELIVLIALSTLVSEHYREKNFALCFLLLLLPINKNGAILLFLVAVLFTILKATNNLQIIRYRFVTWATGLTVLLFIAVYPPTASIAEIFNRVFWRLLFFSIVSFPFWVEEFLSFSQRIKAIIYSLAILSCSFLILGLLNILPSKLSNFVQSRIQVNEVTKNDLTELAVRFRDKSSKDALILTPPSLTRFRLYSERSVVYNFYCSPYTDGGLEEWRNRLAAIVGTIRPPLSLRNIDSFYRKRTDSELVEIARKYGAGYILTLSSWHPNLKGVVVDRQGDWVIYKIANSPQ